MRFLMYPMRFLFLNSLFTQNLACNLFSIWFSLMLWGSTMSLGVKKRSMWSDSSKIRLTNHKKGDGSRSFLIELFLKKIRFIRLNNFQRPEAVAMLVSFPKNVHKLRSEEDIPSYDRFSEKGSKTSKNPKINMVIHLASI